MTTRKLKSTILKIQRIEEKTKALYKQKDGLTETLIGALPVGAKVNVKGRDFTIVDNFETKNQVWSGACVRRFELAEVKPLPTRPKKAATDDTACRASVPDAAKQTEVSA